MLSSFFRASAAVGVVVAGILADTVALERDDPRRAGHLRLGPAHHTGDGLRPRPVGDDEHVVGQRVLRAIQGAHRFSGCRPPDPQRLVG